MAESFSADERAILKRYFTNLDGPVFALVNLPEVVKGALFARYSRSSKSLRRLFLDEFVGELEITGDEAVDATIGLERAEELYERVFFEYGDDSVAQLGGVHLACEQASNLLTKVLEWGRLMSYLEQSTRYIAYDDRLGGRYRYYRDPQLLASPHGAAYVGAMDSMFATYSELLPTMLDYFKKHHPKDPADSDFVYRQAIRAKAFDSLRGLLPAAAFSNVGIYGSGQAYEALLLRMFASELPEANAYATLMLEELRKVIPSFLKRVDLEDRGVAWSNYLRETARSIRTHAEELSDASSETADHTPSVVLTDFDPDGEIKTVAAALYPHSTLSDEQIEDSVRAMGTEDRLAILRASIGERGNRRHKPGRSFERCDYRFDVVSDYGAFRDLQRHRMMTIEWQQLRPNLGFEMAQTVVDAGVSSEYEAAMSTSSALFERLAPEFPMQASYAVALAYRIRYSMQFNAREAFHLLELRSSPQGHPSYRSVAQDMHTQIAEVAGHRAIAAAMTYVDHSDEPDLERLEAERSAARKRELAQRGSQQSL